MMQYAVVQMQHNARVGETKHRLFQVYGNDDDTRLPLLSRLGPMPARHAVVPFPSLD